MEIGSVDFLTALVSIIVIDLVLAGDNAVVIAMASNRLPYVLRKKAIFWGTGGAVAVRIVMTLLAVYLLQIPYLQALGGLILIPIAIKLLRPQKQKENIQAADNLKDAIKTIIVADAAMGIDNVLGVAGAANGSFLLVCIGLFISIPIVVWCSQLIGKLLDKWPVLIYVGSAILGHTAGHMLVADQKAGVILQGIFGGAVDAISYVIAILVCVIGYNIRKNAQK